MSPLLEIPRQMKLILRLALCINMLSVGTLMMVMPLGPDFVKDLGMDAAYIGYLGGGATFSAALVGFLWAPFLDRYNRKTALILCLILKSLTMLICTFSVTPNQLIFWFVLSGCFSGPLGALLMASVIDLTPIEQRGRAISFVASGFSLAAIIVVPVSLELAGRLSWQSSFYVFGISGFVLSALVAKFFPTLKGHEGAISGRSLIRGLMASSLFRLSLFVVSVQMFGHFLLVPNFSSYFQFNLQFPRSEIPYLFLVGGCCSLLALRCSGFMLDNGQARRVLWGSSITIALVAWCGFIWLGSGVIYIAFALFMAMSSVRTSSASAIISRVPEPHERAAFMSLQSTFGNLAAGIASMLAAQYLSADSSGVLTGFSDLVVISAGCTLLVPVLMMGLLSRLKKRTLPVAPTSA